MNTSTCKDEVVIKIIGKLTLEFPDINQFKVREVVEEVLYKYDVSTQETGLVVSDLNEKLSIYLTVKKLDGLAQTTLENYALSIIKLSSYLRKPLALINTMDMRMFLAERCRKLKPSSTNEQISIFKSFFSWLAAEDYIIKNPMLKIQLTKEPIRVRQPLSDEQVELMRLACETLREQCLFEFLLSSGCRLKEVVKINIKDINFHERTLMVIGKGDKEREVCFSVKTKVLLSKYILSRSDQNEALFVTSKSPFSRLSGRSMERDIDEIAGRAGIIERVFPHRFRHTMATRNINAGMPIHILSELLGHSSFETTKIYAKTSRTNILHEYRKVQ